MAAGIPVSTRDCEDDVSVELICGDCLEVMKSIPDKSIDVVITDPPYNIGKAEWDKIDNYIEWCGLWITECQRALKDNGSFYFFHNDMEQIANLMLWIRNNTKFVFKQFIVWNKRFDGASNKGFLDGFVVPEGLRNYQQMAEYLLFYTFQDETGLTTVKLDVNNFPTLRQYFKDYQEALGMTKLEILEKIGQQADHCFRWGSSQWDMPTKETYEALEKLPVKNEFVRREYGDLRREYEDLRYTFNNQKMHHSVWNYEIAPRCEHITPKPVDLLENIIKHSSNENYTILDPFVGSGTTGVACVQTGRNFVGIEIDPGYFAIAEKRIHDAQQQMRLF
jgi:site-specific DNA-methyltransferase (adenine-specific)